MPEHWEVEISIELPRSDRGQCVLLAGTFSDPEWTVQQMQCKSSTSTSHIHVAQVLLKPDTSYSYMFRLEDDEGWFVNDKEPIGTHHSGTQVNVLHLSKRELEALCAKQSGKHNLGYNQAEDEVELKSPLFAHECLGAYEISDDILDDNTTNMKIPRKSHSTLGGDDVDLNDPTLEDFPCDRESILGTLRKIQSSHSDFAVVVDDDPNSSHASNRRSSTGSSDGESTSSRRIARSSQGSTGRNRLSAGLGSIAEEPKTSRKKSR